MWQLNSTDANNGLKLILSGIDRRRSSISTTCKYDIIFSIFEYREGSLPIGYLIWLINDNVWIWDQITKGYVAIATISYAWIIKCSWLSHDEPERYLALTVIDWALFRDEAWIFVWCWIELVLDVFVQESTPDQAEYLVLGEFVFLFNPDHRRYSVY